jgi:hypothetical protein
MTEGADQHEQDSVQDIRNLLDELIDAHHDVEAARLQEEAFRSTHGQPTVAPNTTFPSVEDLLKYNEQRAHYDSEHKQVADHLQEKNRRYQEVAEKVLRVLPPRSSVQHDYGGGSERHSGTYRVTRPDTTGNVVVGRIGPP